jgi:hypothetical protein
MAVTVDISDDFLFFDNFESVTVTLKRTSNLSATIANALRGALSRSELNALGVMLPETVATWFIPYDQLIEDQSGQEMREGDTIAPSGESWHVKSVKVVGAGGSISGWNCICYKAAA